MLQRENKSLKSETKSKAAQLINLRLQKRENPYARHRLDSKEKYMNIMSDPTKHHSDYRDLKREYNSILRRYRNAENGVNASSILVQNIEEAKEIANKEGKIPLAKTGELIDFATGKIR